MNAVRPVRTAPYPGFPTDAQAVLMDEAEREALAAVQAPPVQERKPGLLARLFGRGKK